MAFKNKVAVVEPEGFREKYESWLAACTQLRQEHYEKEYPKFLETTRYQMDVREGSRYITIIAAEYSVQTGEYQSGSYWAMIDRTNGDVLKAAGKVPAKGARGNIFDEHNGMGRISVYGPAYNR
jgi:hypothetical protein